MIKVQQALENIENVQTLAELTDTVLGQVVIEQFAATSATATPKLFKTKSSLTTTELLLRSSSEL